MSDKNREYAEAYVQDAQRAVECAAEELVRLATDLKAYASSFPSTLDKESRGTPTSLAADIITRFHGGVGNIGSARIWSVVYSAGSAERHLALSKSDTDG